MPGEEDEVGLGFSEADLVIAWAELIKAGASEEDIRDGALAATLALAATGDITTADSCRITVDVQEKFGLTAEQLPSVALLYKSGR